MGTSSDATSSLPAFVRCSPRTRRTRGAAAPTKCLLPGGGYSLTHHALYPPHPGYTTFCVLAGIDPQDKAGEAAGLPPVDGIDLWPFISGANATAPRTEVWLGSNGAGDSDNSQHPIVQALIRADGYKVLWGNVIEVRGGGFGLSPPLPSIHFLPH